MNNTKILEGIGILLFDIPLDKDIRVHLIEDIWLNDKCMYLLAQRAKSESPFPQSKIEKVNAIH